MTDYMLTVLGTLGGRDVQVNGADGMREAIAIAEKITGCMVDHGRSGILSDWDPAVIIDASTGDVERRHDKAARKSMMIVNTAKQHGVSAPRGDRS